MVYTVELKHVLITVRDWMLIPVILSISLLDPAKDPYLGLPCWAECASTSCVGRSCDFSAHGSCNAAGLLFSFTAPYSGEGGGGRRCPELDHSRVTANLSQVRRDTCVSHGGFRVLGSRDKAWWKWAPEKPSLQDLVSDSMLAYKIIEFKGKT